MLRLVTIDLSDADVARFEAYESAVLPRVVGHGGQLQMRVRSLDGSRETHLLFFPNEKAYQAYLADPIRFAAQDLWIGSRATAVGIEVEEVLSLDREGPRR